MWKHRKPENKTFNPLKHNYLRIYYKLLIKCENRIMPFSDTIGLKKTTSLEYPEGYIPPVGEIKRGIQGNPTQKRIPRTILKGKFKMTVMYKN